MEVASHDVQPTRPRVKRKPPPSIDLEERYPPPDPDDPFAPLSALRSRSSALFGVSTPVHDNLSPLTVPGCRASFQLFPAAPLDFGLGRDLGLREDVSASPKSPVKPAGEGHYKRRSQSMGPNAHRYPIRLHEAPSQVPGLFPDVSSDSSGTDVDCESVYDTRQSPTTPTRNKIPRIFAPRKKASQLSINSSVSVASSSSKTRIKPSLSLSSSSSLFPQTSPLQSPCSPRAPSIRPRSGHRSQIHVPNNASQESFPTIRDTEVDHGYYSQPEAESRFSPSRRMKRSLGSSLTKCAVIPDVNSTSSNHPTSVIPASIPEASSGIPSLHSSTSFVNVSVPSLVGHVKDNNHPTSPRSTQVTAVSNNRTACDTSLSFPLYDKRRASLRPLGSPSDMSTSSSPPTSPSTTSLYKFPFRLSSGTTKVSSASIHRPASRPLKISGPTLISPPPSVATKDLPTASTASAAIGEANAHRSGSSVDSRSSTLVSPEEPRITAAEDTVVVPVLMSGTKPGLTLPTRSELARAASLPLVTDSGVRITFGSLFSKEATATIVIFIRHFWCSFDQDYIQDLVEIVKYNGITQSTEDVQLVIIGNGSHTLIAKYRQIFKMPKLVRVFTDPTLQLYETLGMGKLGEMCGKVEGGKTPSPYVKRGLFGGIAAVVVRALKVGMSVREKGGETRQLGGEFVFTDSSSCTFAHRMRRRDDHVPIADVFQAAGDSSVMEEKSPTSSHKAEEDLDIRTPTSSTATAATEDAAIRISAHPYAYHERHYPTFSLPLSSPRPVARRRTTSLTSTDVKLKAAARKARVRASTIWSMDVKQYGDEIGRVDEGENEKWKRNLISLRTELTGRGGFESSEE
ncbi:hypothetical protein V5O48_006478 [Marasmius crinis-equi]|uniref:Thioredoxin-like protein AAED1 n=1 Tax=Marasmius crinis-equi TaxID=585013 RepID=A0ABR3FJD8_9AGAR